MSVGVRAMEVSKALYARAPERSLVPTALAIDTTARARYPKQRSNRERYTRFVRDNLRLITAVWLGRPVDVCRIRANHPDLKPTAEDGTFGLDDVLYHVVRSEVLHEKGVTPGLLTVARGIEHLEFGGEHGTLLRFSHRLIEGCLAAVVLAPENKDKRTPEPAPLYLRRKRYWINRLWGRQEYFCREVLCMDVRDPVARGEARTEALLTPNQPAVPAHA
jgi:hypothetical protein